MTNKEVVKIIECMHLLKKEGIDSKTEVYEKLDKLIMEHRKKWN